MMFFWIALFLIGLYLFQLGLKNILKHKDSKLEAVKLEVVDFEEQKNHDDHTVYAPVFKVFSGIYQGTTKLSIYEEVTDKHSLKVGDIIDGYIALPEKDLIAKESLPMRTWMPRWILAIGIVLILASVYFSGILSSTS